MDRAAGDRPGCLAFMLPRSMNTAAPRTDAAATTKGLLFHGASNISLPMHTL